MATQYGVKAKKGLGQHFLADESIARRIVEGLVLPDKSSDDLSGEKLQQLQVLEIGPGTGVLTKYMLQNPQIKLEVCEIDTESIEYLQKTYPQMLYSLQQRDFLQVPLEKIFSVIFPRSWYACRTLWFRVCVKYFFSIFASSSYRSMPAIQRIIFPNIKAYMVRSVTADQSILLFRVILPSPPLRIL